jgi:hypothetical protein
MSDVEFNVHHLETEVRDGVRHTILVIETDIPIPPQTHIDKDVLPSIIQQIKQTYLDGGQTIDDVRLVHRDPPDPHASK